MKLLQFIEPKIKAVNVTLMTGFIVVSVIAIMVVTCTIATISYNSISALNSINLLSIQKNQEIKRLDKLISKVREFHSNVGDYVITRDSSYLKNTATDKKLILMLSRQFADSLVDGGAQRDMLVLTDLIERKISDNENILRLYAQGGRDAALEFIESGKGSILSDSIERVASRIKEFENRELETSVKTYNSAAQQTRITIPIAAILIIFLGFIFMITSVWNLRRRAIIMTELESAKMASEKAALLKTQFISNMSHEIRTPLNSILGFTDILAKTKMDGEQADFVRTIKNASENLLSIVNDVLDFSKIEAGMMRNDARVFSIDELLENLRKLFEHRAKENNLNFEISVDTSVPLKLEGDSNRLNQVLINLVGNAIKFTDRGSVFVKLKAIEVLNDYATLEFKVKDTGVGIARDKMPKIFDRFEQIDSNNSRRHHGTGLGLSIVKSLVELEGGNIRVSSIEGVGTEFVFTVSYKVAHEKTAVAHLNDKAIVARRDTSATLSGRVLLAEDNPVNQKLAGFILKKWGIDFDIAANGAAACIMLRVGNYDLVLMDIQMPEMDGYQATKIIREEMKLRLPIVALTAHAFDGEIEGFTRAGMDGYITKPFKEDDLYDVLAHFLAIPQKSENGFREVRKVGISAPQVIDFTEVEKISGGNKLFVKELAEIFISQVQIELEQLEDAYAKKDIKNLNGIAHSLKSTVGYMGLMSKLDDPLHRIETCVEANLADLSLSEDIAYVKTVCLDAVKQLEIELPEYI